MPTEQQLALPSILLPVNPARQGTQNWMVYEFLRDHGGYVTKRQFYSFARWKGIGNPRARISDLRDMGIDIDAKGPYVEIKGERRDGVTKIKQARADQ